MSQKQFRCECGVFVITDNWERKHCHSCEPLYEDFDLWDKKPKGTVLLRPPKESKDEDKDD